MTKKKNRLQKAFVVTTAAVAFGGLAGACGETTTPSSADCPTSVPSGACPAALESLECSYESDCEPDVYRCQDGEWSGGPTSSCNPPFIECPFELPEADAPCAGEDESLGECTYIDACDQESSATCTGGIWTVIPPAVFCQDPMCPLDLPAAGDVCASDGLWCTYETETACGPIDVLATCALNERQEPVFTVDAPECTPEVPTCDGYEDPSLCSADTTCRWLVPGCGEVGYPFAAGCFPIDDCAVDECGANASCETIDYDPCWNSNCDACGATGTICVSNDA